MFFAHPQKDSFMVFAILSIFLLAPMVSGCPAPKALTPAQAAFKKELQQVVGKLAEVLVEPVSKNDAGACQAALAAALASLEGEGKTLLHQARLGVLNREGLLLATAPPQQVAEADFSQYQVVKETMEQGRINFKQLYAPDGSPLYAVLAPLRKQGQATGLLGLRLSAAQVEQKWGLTEKELLAIDLN